MGLPHPINDLGNRLPVWQACSRFYLESEMTHEDIEYIARACAESPYSSRQLDKIMFCEAWPALIFNLFVLGGEETRWRDEELKALILPKYRRRLNICWWLNPIKLLYCARWLAVKRLVSVQRSAAP